MREFLNIGFLGTRATFLSDLLIITVLLLIPLFSAGYLLARNRKGSLHRMTMFTLYSTVAAYVLIYIVHVLMEGFVLEFREPGTPAHYLFWGLGLFHSFLATGALITGFQTVQLGRGLARKNGKRWYMEAGDRPVHAAKGKIALLFFAGTALTGFPVYYLLFVW